MDDALWHNLVAYRAVAYDGVLILVLMDDALWLEVVTAEINGNKVLILVLMDDALWPTLQSVKAASFGKS